MYGSDVSSNVDHRADRPSPHFGPIVTRGFAEFRKYVAPVATTGR
jgi:hypothetical protein